MKFILRLYFVLGTCALGTVICTGQSTKSLGDIRLLESDRAAVESLLGKPKKPPCDLCEYENEYDMILVQYSGTKCSVEPSGWQVPTGTVLFVQVTPKGNVTFADLKMDQKRVLPYGELLIDERAGLIFKRAKFHPDMTEAVESVTYVPTSQHTNLRCPGFFPYNPLGASYTVTETASDPNMARLYLDNLIFHLESSTDSVAYVIAYSGGQFTQKRLSRFLSTLKQHAFDKRRFSDRDRLKLINGGQLREFRVDIYLIKKGLPPPVPKGKR